MSNIVEVNNTDNVIDIRDVITRFEELEAEKEEVREDKGAADVGWDNRDEFNNLRALLDDLLGNGGNHEWRDNWYPVTLVRDSYFEDYAQELAEDIGAINRDARWPNNCIDWEEATRQLKQDYATVEFDGATYWYR